MTTQMTTQIFDFFIQNSFEISNKQTELHIKEKPRCNNTTVKTDREENDTVTNNVMTPKVQHVFKCRNCKNIFELKIDVAMSIENTCYVDKHATRCVNCWSQFLERLN